MTGIIPVMHTIASVLTGEANNIPIDLQSHA